jgi:uncharacterized metal-binding protein
MSSGKTHALVTTGAAGLLIITAPAYTEILGIESAGMIIGMGAGLFLTPDLDQDNPVYSHYLTGKIYAPLKWIWNIIWLPYAKLIPHRSWVSHAPVVGTLIRIIYLNIITGCLCGQSIQWIVKPLFWWVIIGIAIADFLHWVFDQF